MGRSRRKFTDKRYVLAKKHLMDSMVALTISKEEQMGGVVDGRGRIAGCAGGRGEEQGADNVVVIRYAVSDLLSVGC